MISKWEIKMFNGDSFEITNEEFNKLEKFISTRGAHHARWQKNDGTYLFISQMSHIKPIEFIDDVSIVPVYEIEEETEEPEIDRQQEALREMMRLSSCTHETETLYAQITKTGLKYFPVCDNCLRRGRFVKAENLTEDEKNNAKEWIDKD